MPFVTSFSPGRARSWLATALLASALAGCSHAPQPAPSAKPAAAWPPAETAAASTAAKPGPVRENAAYAWTPKMDATSQQLRSALQGSGADVTQTTDQRLWLSLPVDAVFAKGRSAIAPAGTGSLDKVALALRGHARAQVQIVGDADAGGASAALALDRAASARDWMVARGVPATRIAVASRTPARGGPADARRLDILIGERATPVATR